MSKTVDVNVKRISGPALSSQDRVAFLKRNPRIRRRSVDFRVVCSSKRRQLSPCWASIAWCSTFFQRLPWEMPREGNSAFALKIFW